MNWLRREWRWFWHTDETTAERLLRLFRRRGDVEPYDSWPLCPDCWVRFPTADDLAAHHRRDPICGGGA